MEIRYSKKLSEDKGTDILNKVKVTTEGNSDIIPKNDRRMAVMIDREGAGYAINLPEEGGKIVDVSEGKIVLLPHIVIVNGGCKDLIIPSVNWIRDNTL